MLAEFIRAQINDGDPPAVWELDPSSVLRGLLEKHAATYRRTYYDPAQLPGTERSDGAIMQDVTKTTFSDESFDMIISSDVLEHVPDLDAAFVEMGRALKSGGRCIFTVPTNDKTIQRAAMEPNSTVRHLLEPEYHSDPLNPRGILAFWSLGFDLPERFSNSVLTFKIAKGPEGVSRRIVWEATKTQREPAGVDIPGARQAIP
jgi:SAM-dependent methyltransferase